ncbi:hypothetical protein [Burkholderia pseudomultivorans]|uniref:hypothetical protein n=1 Tax=Burkholderia pseudomultivorans TaxID=1207504 RepID=UPI0028707C78|nr:hypothetical protein [Burkholderia pseudomultivorans]
MKSSRIVALPGGLLKVLLFIWLFLVSARYIPLSNEWTPAEARAWWRVSEWLGVPDPDDLYFVVWVTIELIVAVLAYIATIRLWRHYRNKKIQVEKWRPKMISLTRALLKALLFAGLFLLSVRCIGRNGAMPESEALRWLSIAQRFGVREADDIHIPVMLALDLLATTLAYMTITKLWKYFRRKKSMSRNFARK